MSTEAVIVEFDPNMHERIRLQTISAAELIVADLPPRERLVEPILPAKGLAMLYGPRELGKTHVAMGIAWTAASGANFLKWRAERPRRVFYVDGEMPAADMQERLRMTGSSPATLRFLLADMQEALARPRLARGPGRARKRLGRGDARAAGDRQPRAGRQRARQRRRKLVGDAELAFTAAAHGRVGTAGASRRQGRPAARHIEARGRARHGARPAPAVRLRAQGWGALRGPWRLKCSR